jgi:6-methylsalicylic acid synthase
VDRVHIGGAPPAVGLIHVRRRPGTTVTDVTISDATGQVLVVLDGMGFEELEGVAGSDPARILHDVTWHPVTFTDGRLPTEVVLVGGDAETLAVVVPDLAASNVPYRVCAGPDELPADLDPGAVVLALPRTDDTPAASADLVVRTVTAMHASGSAAKVWVLTQRVHDGDNIHHAPLWGLARVAAAEHPRLWGGVLDLPDARIPFGALAALAGHGVVVMRDGSALAARLDFAAPGDAEPLTCIPGGTYLITGGTGALGLVLAQRLADLGARRLVLLSRSGLPERSAWPTHPNREAVRVVSSLEDRGVSVVVAAVDIGAPGAADDLRAVLRDLPEVRGVIHAAGVETGALLVDTTAADLAATMRPKVDGALTLHEVFPPGQLDWLVLFSSCGYLPGFPGQGAYAGANAFLDTFAQHRRARGDRATSVAWTAWRGVGMGSGSGFVAAQLEALGMDTVGTDDALRALDAAVRADRAHLVVLPVLPAAAAVPMLAAVAPCPPTESEAVDPAGPGDVDPEVWATEQVLAAVATELGLAAGEVDLKMPLVEIGVDSIMTVAVRRELERHTGLSLPPTLLWEYPTATAVIARVVELLDETRAPGAADGVREPTPVP